MEEYQQIVSDKIFILEAAVEKGSLKLRLRAKANKNKTIISGTQITSFKDLGILEKWCENFDDLKKYLENKKNVSVDPREATVTITASNPIKQDTTAIISKIKLLTIKTVDSSSQLAFVSKAQNIPNNNSVLYQNLKKDMEAMANEIKQLNKQIKKIKMDKKLESKKYMTRKQFQQEVQNIKESILKYQEEILDQHYRPPSMLESQFQFPLMKDHYDELDNLPTFEKKDRIVKQQEKSAQSIIQLKKKLGLLKQQKVNQNSQTSKLSEQSSSKANFNKKNNPQQSSTVSLNNTSKVKQILANQWLDLSLQSSKSLIIQQQILTSISSSTFVFPKNQIKALSARYNLIIKIQKCQGLLSIGITDINNKGKSSMKALPKCYQFRNNGWYWDGYNKVSGWGKNGGFKQGKYVKICVDFQYGVVKWVVGKSIKHTITSEQLKSKDTSWIPFIGFYQKNSKVALTQQNYQ